MKNKKIKPWFLIYSLIFCPLSVSFVENNFDNQYHIIFCIWSVLIYLAANIGNFLYSFSFENDAVTRCWKIIFPLFVFHFVLGNIVDTLFGSHAPEFTWEMNLFYSFIGLILFFPGFRANYRLGFLK